MTIPKFYVLNIAFISERQSVLHVTGVIKWSCKITRKGLENQVKWPIPLSI